MINIKGILLVPLLVALLAGCAGSGERREPVQSEPAGGDGDAKKVEPAASLDEQAAVRSLLQRGEAALSRGDVSSALQDFERAQRLSPAAAGVYLALARAYRAAGRPDQADAMAQRGLLYCGGAKECQPLIKFRERPD